MRVFSRAPDGYVFLAVLVFLQIFGTLGFYGLMNAAQHIKTVRQQWQLQESTLQSDYYLQKIEHEMMNTIPACRISIISASELSKKPLSWWQVNACSANFNKIQYYYVVESLGYDPCGVIRANNKLMTSAYYRITLLSIAGNRQMDKIILQSTLAKENAETKWCSGTTHDVRQGRQWMFEL